MITKIFNANIFTPQGCVKDGAIIIDGGIISDVSDRNIDIADCKTIDAKGMYALPGGIELHCHGGGGHDFMEGTDEAFNTAVEVHLKHGTTAIYPTLATSSNKAMKSAAETCDRLMENPDSTIMGLHFEGPYLNKNMAGGMITEYLRLPDEKEYRELIGTFKCIKRWDSAPELPGALDFGRYLSKNGVLAAVAHTQAEFSDITAAWNAGYTLATHLYNAMTGFHKQREFKHEGTVESIYLTDEMDVELIADGIHLPPALIKLAYKIKGAEHSCVITDAMAYTDCKCCQISDPRVIVEDNVCKLADRSALAGSIATHDQLIRTLVYKAGISLSDAAIMSATTPAKIMGIDNRKGALQKGKDADITFFDENLCLKDVWTMGKRVDLQ